MIASVEKQRFVYVINRDGANRLTISSPLEAHKSESILFSVCGVDVGFDNPIFALIELDYAAADQDPSGAAAEEAEKKLTYYELDLGLNHVVRRWSEPISRTANLLLAVPGGDDGPSGVLICGENWISYKHQGHAEVRAAIPRRKDYPAERGLLIVSGAAHRQKDLFFFLVQSEIGDLYKVSLELDPNNKNIVTDVIISVFDAIQPANSICVTKTGLLFAASEFGNHSLFQFQSIGDEEAPTARRVRDEQLNEELGDDSLSAARVAPTFTATARLKNLLLVDEISSLAPIVDLMADELAGEETPQLVALCGRGHRSTLRVLRHGAAVSEVAASDLPGRAQAVWTLKLMPGEAYDRYIVVSLSSSTLVLSVGETVEEVADSGFLTTTSTLQAALLDDGALLQVHPHGIRHIRQDKRVQEWKPPQGGTIERAAVNARQVVISVGGGELFYFELDLTGQLMEMGSEALGKDVGALDMGVVPPGRVRSSFLAVGFWDSTVQVLSLDPSALLQRRSMMTLSARAESLCFVTMATESAGVAAGASSSAADAQAATGLYLNVGLSTGVIIRSAVDPITGDLSDTRQRFLGTRAVKLFRVPFLGQAGVMALSTRPWVMYSVRGRYHQVPVTCETLEYVSSFCSEQCPEGAVAVSGSTLRIFTLEGLGAQFNETVIPLRYTPRKMCRLGTSRQVVVIESDHNEFSEAERQALATAATANTAGRKRAADDMAVDEDDVDGAAPADASPSSSSSSAAVAAGDGPNGEEGEEDDGEFTTLPLRGPVPAAEGKWASCLRLIEPGSGTTLDLLELTSNEAAFSVCTCRFGSDELFVVVGVARDFVPMLRRAHSYALKVYRILDNRFQFVHQTEAQELPQAMMEFQGQLLVGGGRVLRLFGMGRKKLLLKSENRVFPNNICRLQASGDRIFVGDSVESVHFVRYRRLEKTLSIFADDVFPRFTTALCVLDHDTVAAADKFGNVYVLRLPEGASDSVEVSSGVRQLWDVGLLNGAPSKLECLTHYFLGETVTSLTKRAMVIGGPELLLASTVAGGLYALVPFAAKEDVVFFQHLEMFLRQESPSLCQRDHLSYRSYFMPVKETVDGDLCERFAQLPVAKQKEFAADADRTPAEVLKKIEDARNVI